MVTLVLIVFLLVVLLIVTGVSLIQEHKEVNRLLDLFDESKKQIPYIENDEYDFGHNVKIKDVDFEEEINEPLDSKEE